MNGLTVGSGEGSPTCPRLRGLSTHAEIVMPCAGGGSRPLLRVHRGDHVELHVGRLEVLARAHEAAALGEVRRQRTAAAHRPAVGASTLRAGSGYAVCGGRLTVGMVVATGRHRSGRSGWLSPLRSDANAAPPTSSGSQNRMTR